MSDVIDVVYPPDLQPHSLPTYHLRPPDDSEALHAIREWGQG